MTGDMRGIVTCRSWPHHPAPSTRDASYSSVGTFWRPATLMMIALPIPQSPIMISDG